MKLDWKINIGDILTSFTILISVVALVVAWVKDGNIKETSEAFVVRTAASKAITQLDRWQSLNLSLYQELQVEFITASELFNEHKNIIKTRDYLWKKIVNKRLGISQRILNENITTSYVDLLGYFPDTRAKFIEMFNELNKIEQSISSDFLFSSQEQILNLKEKEPNYTSAMLGNALRLTASQHKDKLFVETTRAIRPIRKLLFDIIVSSNEQILQIDNVAKLADYEQMVHEDLHDSRLTISESRIEYDDHSYYREPIASRLLNKLRN